MKTLVDFKKLVTYNTSERKPTGEENKLGDKLFRYLDKEFGSLENLDWEDEKFLAALKNFSKTEKVPFKIIYFLLTGRESGIGLLELNQIYGKEFFLKNLKS
jgi:hypothetical protein